MKALPLIIIAKRYMNKIEARELKKFEGCLREHAKCGRARILCNGVNREDIKASPDLAFRLFCFVPLHKI